MIKDIFMLLDIICEYNEFLKLLVVVNIFFIFIIFLYQFNNLFFQSTWAYDECVFEYKLSFFIWWDLAGIHCTFWMAELMFL